MDREAGPIKFEVGKLCVGEFHLPQAMFKHQPHMVASWAGCRPRRASVSSCLNSTSMMYRTVSDPALGFFLDWLLPLSRENDKGGVEL